MAGVRRLSWKTLWGYEYHWTDGSGSYRSSNDGTYDPNATENSGSWQLMKPTE